MIKLGDFNELKVLTQSDFGLKLDGGEEFGEILLPNRLVPEVVDPSLPLKVFLCHDSEDRLMATTEIPLAKVGEVAALKVVSLSRVGAFLDWGLSKDLFLPFSEQLWDLNVGDLVVVYLYIDKSNRISASMRIDKQLKTTRPNFTSEQVVQILIYDKTDLGFKAVVEGQYQGLLFSNEVFQKLDYAQKLSAFVRRVRDDGKVDLNLASTGHKAAAGIEDKILQVLQDNGGRFAVNDKTDPAMIYRVFGASKKKFKIALGGLYKARKILITDEGIRLVNRGSGTAAIALAEESDSSRSQQLRRGNERPRPDGERPRSDIERPRRRFVEATAGREMPKSSVRRNFPAKKSNSESRITSDSKPITRGRLFGFED